MIYQCRLGRVRSRWCWEIVIYVFPPLWACAFRGGWGGAGVWGCPTGIASKEITVFDELSAFKFGLCDYFVLQEYKDKCFRDVPSTI